MQLSDKDGVLRCEYRLSFWQALYNPIGALIAKIFLLLIVLSLGYLLWLAVAVAYFIGAAIIAIALLFLSQGFFGYRPGTRTMIYISFGKEGLSTNSGRSETPSRGIPYRFLTVRRGLAGTSLIDNIAGSYIVVPTRVLGKEELERLIRERQVDA
jgi:hypothetical protein